MGRYMQLVCPYCAQETGNIQMLVSSVGPRTNALEIK